MPWLELTVTSRYPEFVEALLDAAGAQAIVQNDAADTPVLEPGPGETPLWVATRTCGLFTSDSDLCVAEKSLRDNLPAGDTPVFSRREIADADWVHAWQEGVSPMHFGGPLWVRPAGMALPPQATSDACIVELDPGLAFGTGTHPSTALCLKWLAANPVADCRVLDYGCGSGILAIAALKLGAREAWVTDIDPQALTATQENARNNHVDNKLHVFEPDELPRNSAADVILANILANPLVALAARLSGHARSGTRLVLAGLLPEQQAAICKAYGTNFIFDTPCIENGWLRLTATAR